MGLEGQTPPPPPGAAATLPRPEAPVSVPPQPVVSEPVVDQSSSSENPDNAASVPPAFLDMDEPRAQDVSRTAESTQDERSGRVERLAMAILNREIQSTENTIREIETTDPDAATAARAEPNTSALLTLGKLQNLPEGESLDFSGGEPLLLPDGVTVTGMTRNGDVYMCTVEGVDTQVPVSQQDIIDAQLDSEAESILAKIAGENEKHVVRKYIDVIRSGEIALPTQGSEGAKALDNAMGIVEDKLPQEATPTTEGRFIAEQLARVEADIARIEETRAEVERSRDSVKASKSRIAELEAKKAKVAAGEELPQEEVDELNRLNEAQTKVAQLDKLPEYQRLQRVLAEAAKADQPGSAYAQWLGLEQIIKVRKGEDIEGLWDARRAVADRLPKLQNELVHYMYASGGFTQEEIDAVRRGDRGAIDNLLGSGKLRDQEMAEYFFHKGITPEEIDAFVKDTDLTPEQLSFLGKHKGTLLLVLFLALKETTVMANDMILKQEGR